MVTSTFHRFVIKHLTVINNIKCLSSKSTQSTLSATTTTLAIKPICHPSQLMKSSLSCKTLPTNYNPNNNINNYLNCHLLLSQNQLINLRFYSTDNRHIQQRQQQKSSINSESDFTLLQPDKILMRYVDELIDFREKKPTRTWLTVIKVLITMFAGVNFGAFMAKLGATLLEKYEIFVRDDDDSDD
ncbi:uncharacterized protein LOC128389434 [Panonychus citri]|uniref:uncharacterized protein LOC128389434 n=1 Tax=Panonychus citri TaxID=50023 RepID=UPI0023073033|nr:uncharacterized protein LOC128389434 [Panonychus citri]